MLWVRCDVREAALASRVALRVSYTPIFPILARSSLEEDAGYEAVEECYRCRRARTAILRSPPEARAALLGGVVLRIRIGAVRT